VVDFNSEVIVDAQCAADGSRMAFVRQPFSSRERLLDIHGNGAPAEPISLPSTTQAFAWSPDGTRIALVHYDGMAQTHKIVVLNVATGEEEELTTGPDFAGSLTFSPDGSRIAYYVQRVSDGDTQIFTIPASGGEPQQVSEGDLQWYDPNWSPDGKKILVAGLKTEDFQLYEIDPDSGETRQLTSSDIFKRGAKYSPGGDLIAYTGSIVLAQVALAPSLSLHSFGIFILNADGSDEHAFTADPRLNPGAAVDPYLDAYFIGWCARGPWLDDSWQPVAAATTPAAQ
jgi:Tol biopolymer transport system component